MKEQDKLYPNILYKFISFISGDKFAQDIWIQSNLLLHCENMMSVTSKRQINFGKLFDHR